MILSVDHPFVPEGRVASLMVRDAALAKRLADGFETLWSKAMTNSVKLHFSLDSDGTAIEKNLLSSLLGQSTKA